MSNRQPLNADTPGPPPPANTALALQQPFRLQTALEHRHEEQATDESLTLTDLLRIVVKHKWTLLIVILLACAAAAVRTFLSTPVYRSTVILQIERVAPRVVNFNNEVDPDQAAATSDETTSLKTQYELLKSRSLAERVIDELRLDQFKPAPAAGGTDGAAASDSAPAEGDPQAKTDYLERLVSGYRKITSPTTRDTNSAT